MSYDDYVDDYDMWADEADDPDMYAECPKCGGKLVRRNGKYGEFYGCENFSSGCKFTCKADQVIPAVLCEKPKEENMETKAATSMPASEMTLDSRLKFLELAKDFTVDKPAHDDADWEYRISAKDGNLVAFFDKGEFRYYVSGVYNSGSSYAEIDVDELDRLRAFCETLKNGYAETSKQGV